MKILLTIAVSFLLADVLFLNWIILFKKGSSTPTVAQTNETKQPVITQSPNVCPTSCLAAIKQATQSATAQTQNQYQAQPQPAAATPSEFIVPLGGGSFSSTTWANMPGLQVYLNPSNYPGIKTVTFEASISVPTANETVNIQLFNTTAGHPVWNSTMFFAGGAAPQLLISQPITLDPGNNLYQVQMQTQLTFPANIDQAIIRIQTN